MTIRAFVRPVAYTVFFALFARADDRPADFRALVFSRTTGFRHDSIPDGVLALKKLGAERGFAVDATEDPTVFTPGNLARYRVVVLLSATGNVFTPDQRSALAGFLKGGGGLAGIHAAVGAEPDWPEFDHMLGTRFRDHPAVQEAAIRVEDREHPSTRTLPTTWVRTDEWYNWTGNPRGRGDIRVLATLDESTYKGGSLGKDHPIVWWRPVGRGRLWYSALGHTKEAWVEPLFLDHVEGGIRFAAGLETPAKAAEARNAVDRP